MRVIKLSVLSLVLISVLVIAYLRLTNPVLKCYDVPLSSHLDEVNLVLGSQIREVEKDDKIERYYYGGLASAGDIRLVFDKESNKLVQKYCEDH